MPVALGKALEVAGCLDVALGGERRVKGVGRRIRIRSTWPGWVGLEGDGEWDGCWPDPS